MILTSSFFIIDQSRKEGDFFSRFFSNSKTAAVLESLEGLI